MLTMLTARGPPRPVVAVFPAPDVSPGMALRGPQKYQDGSPRGQCGGIRLRVRPDHPFRPKIEKRPGLGGCHARNRNRHDNGRNEAPDASTSKPRHPTDWPPIHRGNHTTDATPTTPTTRICDDPRPTPRSLDKASVRTFNEREWPRLIIHRLQSKDINHNGKVVPQGPRDT
jgi:hypothetical protein